MTLILLVIPIIRKNKTENLISYAPIWKSYVAHRYDESCRQ